MNFEEEKEENEDMVEEQDENNDDFDEELDNENAMQEELDDNDEIDYSKITDMKEAEQILEINQFNLSLLVQLSKLYKEHNLTAKLSQIREKMQRYFILPEVADVLKKQIKYGQQLFEQKILTKNQMKAMFEKGIVMFFHDFDQGSKYFNKLRKFYIKNNEPKATILNLFQRQLKQPYSDIAATWDVYQNWETDEASLKQTEQIYKQTEEKIQSVLDIEDKFRAAFETENLSEILKFFESEEVKSQIEIGKVQNFYEHVLDEFPGDAEVWASYINFIKKNFTSSQQQEKYLRRAAKNCYEEISFVKDYLRCLIKNQTDIESFESEFNKFQEMLQENDQQFQLFEILTNFYERKIIQTAYEKCKNQKNFSFADCGEIEQMSKIQARNSFSRAIQLFTSKLDENASEQEKKDISLYIQEFQLQWGYFETFITKDKQQFTQIMEQYIRQNGSQFDCWVEYIDYEQFFGNINSLRSLLKRGCEYVKDKQIEMIQQYIEFEKKFGDFEQLEAAEKRLMKKLQEIQEQKEKEELEAQKLLEEEQKYNQFKNKKRQQFQQKKNFNQDDQSYNLKKRNFKEFQNDKNQNQKFGRFVKAKELEEENKDEDNQQEDGFDNKRKLLKQGEQPNPVQRDSEQTLFIKNLPQSIDEEQLYNLFPNKQEITQCRLKQKKGRNKFAYVDFSSPEEAQKGLSLNNKSVQGQRLFVAFSKPPTKLLDSNSLFLNYLPENITEEKILTAINDFNKAKVKEVRLFYDSSNKIKEYAYIEFHNHDDMLDCFQRYENVLMIDGKSVAMQQSHQQQQHTQQDQTESNKQQNLQQKQKIIIKSNQQQPDEIGFVVLLQNLSFKAKEKDIKQFFNKYEIDKIHIVKDEETNKSKGYAFVEFKNNDDFEEILQMQEGEICKRVCKFVKSDRPITEKKHAKQVQVSLSRSEVLDVKDDHSHEVQNKNQIEKKEDLSQKNINISDGQVQGMKSNADFRTFLFKK